MPELRRWTAFFVLALSTSVFALSLEPDLSFEGYAIGARREVAASVLNPANRALLIAEWEAMVDLRPELKLDAGDRVRIVARPRLRASAEWRPNLLPTAYDPNRWPYSRIRFHFDEAYAQVTAADWLRLAAGIQNYQWGPAEFFSPSNPLIHFTLDQRTVIFRQRGKPLFRANVSFGSKSTLIGLFEPIGYDEVDWISGVAHTPRAVLRFETELWRPGDYVGVTAGLADREQYFVGEYASVYLGDVVSAYFDARHMLGSPASYPSGGAILPSKVNEGEVNTLLIAGLRHEGFFDTRLEYLWNRFGYTESQWSQALQLAAQNPLVAGRLLRAGLELPKQHYAYASFRTDKLASGDSLRLAVRYLHSLQDHSGSLFTALEWAFSDNYTVIVEPMLTHGGPNGEFSQATRWDTVVELRAAF